MYNVKVLFDFYAEYIDFFEDNDIVFLYVFDQIETEVHKRQDG